MSIQWELKHPTFSHLLRYGIGIAEGEIGLEAEG